MVEVITQELLPGARGRGMLKRRLPSLTALVLLLFAGSFARIVCLAASPESAGPACATSPWMRTIVLPATRGRILDRRGLPLAVTPVSYQLLAAPAKVKRLNSSVRSLAPVVNVPEEHLASLLSSKKDVVGIRERLAPSQASRIEQMALGGIYLRRERRGRLLHPSVRLQSKLVNLIEDRYDAVLAGRPGKLFSAPRRKYHDGAADGVLRSEPVNGTDITLSLNGTFQDQLRSALGGAVVSAGASRGLLLIMKAGTGEIYADLAGPHPARESTPLFALYRPEGLLDDCRLALTCEGKRSGQATTRFDEEKARLLEGESEVRRSRTVRQLERSDKNERAEQPLPFHYLADLGFGRPTGVDLAGEPAGSLAESEVGNGLAGEILATPLQIAASYAQLVNGGKAVKPHFLLKYGASDGRCDVMRASKRGGKIKETYLRELCARGAGGVPELQGYDAGGKVTSCRTADGNLPCAAFLGCVKAGESPWIFLVILEECQGAQAREAVLRAFGLSAREFLRTERVAPDLEALRADFVNESLMKELRK